MGTRNRTLLIVFIALIAVNVLVAITGKQNRSVSFDVNLFAVDNEVNSISIGEVSLAKNGEGWMVNDRFPSDPNLTELLRSILQRVEVKKPLAELPDTGSEVYINGELQFTVSTNPTKTKTYFTRDGERYEVHIPGYNEFLGGIFELNEDQWRDRLVIDASWRTIQRLELDYTEETREDLNIQFDEDFFLLKGVAGLDSNKIVDYLNQFQVFQINEWISEGRFSRYDSLANTKPMAELSIETINSNAPIVFSVYPKLGADRFHLLKDGEQSLMVVDENRVNLMLKSVQYFELEN